jgi:uncharacterized lipoprotein YddW (UPF0748 family)
MKAVFCLQQLSLEKAKDLTAFDAVFTGHHNLTTDAIKFLHQNKTKVYVEIGLFAGKKWWEKYPNSRPITKQGQKIKQYNWYAGVCPNHPEVKKDNLNIIKKLINNYDIDGLWLDFIRYPCHWEDVRDSDIDEYCYCDNCIKNYQKEVGKDLKEKQWYEWKNNQITNYVGEIKELVKKNKNITLGLFAVPWRKRDYDQAINSIICQDFKALADHIDVFSPMTYHKMVGNNPQWIFQIIKYMKQQTKKPILPLVQTEDKPSKLSAEEFKQSINQAVKDPSDGVIIFFWEDLIKSKDKTNLVKHFL